MSARSKSHAAKTYEDPAEADRAWIDGLFRSEAPRLLRYFRRTTRDNDAAGELVQETFLRFAGLSNLATLRNPAAYLQRVARNLLFDRTKHNSARLTAMHVPFDEQTDAAIEPNQSARLNAADLLLQYQGALMTLTPKTRQVFLLHRVEGLTYREIQEQLGISMGTVEYHIMRALAHFDQRLGDR